REVNETPCRHRYHKDCIDKWLENHNTCPVGRFQMPLVEENNSAASGAAQREEEGERRRGRRVEEEEEQQYHCECASGAHSHQHHVEESERPKRAHPGSYRGIGKHGSGGLGGRCPICLEGFDTDREARETPCRHRYHKDCINKWLENHNTCLVCRFQMPLVEENNSAAGGAAHREEEGLRSRSVRAADYFF
ncbi:E3 ubiquitin-protein ligase, partial [Nymphaea thermarum]